MSINRIVFLSELGNVRLGPHNTDPTKMILKADQAETVAAFCEGLDLTMGSRWQGNHYHITEVPKADIVVMFSRIAEVVSPQSKALASPVCAECNAGDGDHWASCSYHLENVKALN